MDTTSNKNGSRQGEGKGKGKGKGKVAPRLEGSKQLRFPDFVTKALDGGKVISLTHRPPLTPGNASGTHFC